MKTKRSISLVVVLASLVLFVGACGSDTDSTAKKSDKTTTTAKNDSDKGSKETTTTISDDKFADQVGKVNDDISDAGTDPCKLMEALNSAPPTPGNTEQAKKLIDTYSTLLRAVANALPASSASNVKALNDAAEKVQSVAKDKEYSPDIFTSQELGQVMSSQEVTTALSEFTGLTSKCTPATTEGSTPEG